jgi:hypothetical protein
MRLQGCHLTHLHANVPHGARVREAIRQLSLPPLLLLLLLLLKATGQRTELEPG